MEEPKWIRFVEQTPPISVKTSRWTVEALNGAVIGIVMWHGPWRQYALCSNNAIYEPRCLRDIANFCEEKTREHRKGWKRRQ